MPWTPQSEAVPKSVSALLVRLDEPAGPSLPLPASNALKRAQTRTAVGLVDDDVDGGQLEVHTVRANVSIVLGYSANARTRRKTVSSDEITSSNGH